MQNEASIYVTFDGQGVILHNGTNKLETIPFKCKIVKWYIFSKEEGMLTFDIAKEGLSITGEHYPQLNIGTKNNGNTSNWINPILNTGEEINIKLTSCFGITKGRIILILEKL